MEELSDGNECFDSTEDSEDDDEELSDERSARENLSYRKKSDSHLNNSSSQSNSNYNFVL